MSFLIVSVLNFEQIMIFKSSNLWKNIEKLIQREHFILDVQILSNWQYFLLLIINNKLDSFAP